MRTVGNAGWGLRLPMLGMRSRSLLLICFPDRLMGIPFLFAGIRVDRRLLPRRVSFLLGAFQNIPLLGSLPQQKCSNVPLHHESVTTWCPVRAHVCDAHSPAAVGRGGAVQVLDLQEDAQQVSRRMGGELGFAV